MVVSDPAKALFVFEEHGTLVVEDDVLMITGDNKPGSLAKVAHKLAAAKSTSNTPTAPRRRMRKRA